jgi:hypothetical protein
MSCDMAPSGARKAERAFSLADLQFHRDPESCAVHVGGGSMNGAKHVVRVEA